MGRYALKRTKKSTETNSIKKNIYFHHFTYLLAEKYSFTLNDCDFLLH